MMRAMRSGAIGPVLGAVFGMLLLAACATMERNHGYVPDEEAIRSVVIGVDTRDSVAETLGRPTTGGVIDDRAWYYVRYRVRQRGPRAPEIVDREVVAVSFAADGTVANIERFGLEDGRVVVLSRKVTTSNVMRTPFIRQLLKNLGRFDIGQAAGL